MQAWTMDGRVAVVTGGSRGIGAAIVGELLALGARVIAVARNAPGLSSLREQLGHPARLQTIAADVADPAGRKLVIAAIEESGGVLHALFLNHGVAQRVPVGLTTPADSHLLFSINYEAAIQMAIDCRPALVRAKQSAVVAIGSVAGMVAFPDRLAYGASKAALAHAMRSLALAWGGDGIRVNSVLPYFTDTPMVSGILANDRTAEIITAATALGRVSEAVEVARAAVFLALPAASGITGHSLVVDGGFSAIGVPRLAMAS
jgi:tropinone reductase I